MVISFKESCFNDSIIDYIMFEWFLPIVFIFIFLILLVGYIGLFIKSLGG